MFFFCVCVCVCVFFKTYFQRESRQVLYVIEELMKWSFQINVAFAHFEKKKWIEKFLIFFLY